MDDRNDSSANEINRLGFTFHRTFMMKRSAIKQVLDVVDAKDEEGKNQVRRKDIRTGSQLGTIYVEAMPRWAWGSGILNANKELTRFGQYVCSYDMNMEQSNTLWLMHYHLSAPHGPGPTFWHEIVSKHFRSGDEFSQEEITQEIGELYEKEKGQPFSHRSATSTANIFLKTYVDTSGLGRLGLLEEVRENHYRVAETDYPPIWAVAAAILDYWQTHFTNQVTVNLNSLTSESGLASLFMISRSRLDMILGEMREAGIVELFRVAPPYQVALLDSDPENIYRRMYSHEQSS